MIQIYYVYYNADSDGDHEVHVAGCAFMKVWVHKKYLGRFESSVSAVAEAKKTYPKTSGCENCCYASTLINF